MHTLSSSLLCALVLGALPAFAENRHPGPSREEQIRAAKVVVVSGSADHMDQVLHRAEVKFIVVRPDELPSLPLNSGQVLMVNCRGEMSEAARDRVRRFVAAGGFLYTTDHALAELVQKVFPNTIAFNNVTTTEAVFPMQLRGAEADRGLLKHLDGKHEQRWQLAGGGYLFKVLDPKKVEVLMESKQVALQYGTGALAARFRYQDGVVIHVTGHFFTQPGQRPEVAAAGRAFEQLSQNVVTEKAADQGRIDALYNAAPRREVTLQAAPSAEAPPVPAASVTTQSLGKSSKVRVLESRGGYVRVRDEQGNEGWADKEAF
ncbi:MAG: SH3 domain-containing protein [Myxococcaceae bacterium]